MRPDRKITRLRGYDYCQGGAYFITICVHRRWRRRSVWGQIREGKIYLNRFGSIVRDVWQELPQHHRVATDEFVVMPNHLHGILFLYGDQKDKPEERGLGALKPASLSVIVGAFKSAVTRRVGQLRGCPTKIWQPRFYDRIIRDENELNRVRGYIIENPLNWPEDEQNPAHPNFIT